MSKIDLRIEDMFNEDYEIDEDVEIDVKLDGKVIKKTYNNEENKQVDDEKVLDDEKVNTPQMINEIIDILVDEEDINKAINTNGYINNKGDLIIRHDAIDESYILLQESESKKHNKEFAGARLIAQQRMEEYRKEMELEKNRKKERQRLYKTDKKCYNEYKDDKNCKKEERFERKIETRINMKKVRRLLKYHGITQEQLAKKLGLTKRSIQRKLTMDTDFTANEFIELADILGVDIKELINKHRY